MSFFRTPGGEAVRLLVAVAEPRVRRGGAGGGLVPAVRGLAGPGPWAGWVNGPAPARVSLFRRRDGARLTARMRCERPGRRSGASPGGCRPCPADAALPDDVDWSPRGSPPPSSAE
ncbi:hypothetical protein SSP35_18_00250 [Streptomyces sp. NBRC 110611]|nr:hypothetical protein SSP35_18_00250 [Streptomyces sp. NBRC 110611]